MTTSSSTLHGASTNPPSVQWNIIQNISWCNSLNKTMNLHVFVCSTALIQLYFYQVFKHWFIVSYLNLYFYWLLFIFTYWDILLHEPLTIQLSIFYHLSRAEVQTSLSSATSSSSVGGTQGRSQASSEIRSLRRVPSLPQSLLLRTCSERHTQEALQSDA